MEVIAQFDYHELDQPTADVLQQHARRLNVLSQNTATTLWEMGSILADAQERLAQHRVGTFGRWIEKETGLSTDMAYRMINVHRSFNLRNLQQYAFAVSALYLLSKPSTPQDARDDAIGRAATGETITHQAAQEIVHTYRPMTPPPAPPPEREPEQPPEYREFEREQILPHLHDAGYEDAPQVMSASPPEMPEATDEDKDRAEVSLREAITQVVRNTNTSSEESVEACVTEILDILGQGHNSISLAAQFGVALAHGPVSLPDLTEIACRVNGVRKENMDRTEYLAMRKRVLRLLDSLTYSGCGLFEHTLENRQLVYGLLPCDDGDIPS